MKLLYLTQDKYPPFRADVVELFARRLPKMGNRIDWLLQKQDNKKHLSDLNNSKVFLIPCVEKKRMIGRIINFILLFLGEWYTIILALKNKYDVIQVRDKFLTCIPALFAARLTGAKFCYWMSYPISESKIYLSKNNLTNKKLSFFIFGHLSHFFLYHFILRFSDHIFVQSQQMLEDVAKMGINVNKMSVVLMGIKKEQVENNPVQNTINIKSPKLLYLGTLVKIRRLDFLLNVHKKLLEQYPEAQLQFIGDGENPDDRIILENRAKELGIKNNVLFTGFLPMDDAWQYVKDADICYSPFYPIPILLSTSPTKLIEYMAMNKIVIANEHPEQCEVLAKSGAGKCIPWNEDDFFDAIKSILENPQVAIEKAVKGSDYVLKYRTYEVISNQVNMIYRELINA